MKYNCLNSISKLGLERLTPAYESVADLKDAEVVFVRSAKMDELEVGAGLLSVARAGAGVNNIPHADYAKRVSWSSIRPGPTPTRSRNW